MKTQEGKVARNEWVREQRLKGRSMKSIAEELGKTEGCISAICRKMGCSGVMVSPESYQEHQREAARKTGLRLRKTEAQINQELAAYNLEYISGYENCDSLVRVRCIKCGHEMQRNYNFTRKDPKHVIACPECERIEREKAKARDKALRAHGLALQRIQKAKQVELCVSTCRQCGQPFIQDTKYKNFCSERCRKSATNRRKDRRLNHNNIIDKDITLERLFKRDSGVCYICGKTCDWQDFIVENGITICGDDYPSIEHVAPLSKGGKHSWNNVRLACRGCNNAKHTRPLSEFLMSK